MSVGSKTALIFRAASVMRTGHVRDVPANSVGCRSRLTFYSHQLLEALQYVWDVRLRAAGSVRVLHRPFRHALHIPLDLQTTMSTTVEQKSTGC